MAWLYVYGDTKPVPFRLIDSNGDKVIGRTFLANDLYWAGWDGTTWSAFAADGTNVAEVGRGFYVWTPSASSKTQNEIVLLDIEDSTGATFLDNAIVAQTGGDTSAYHDG